MGAEKRDAPAMHAQPFPDPVTEHKPTVEDGHPGLVAGSELAVHIDQYIAVARVVAVLVGSHARQGPMTGPPSSSGAPRTMVKSA